MIASLLLLLLMQDWRPHVIHVVDDRTGRGVPLTELCTTSNACFITDSNGIVALYEPAYWNRDVFFYIRSHGYEHAKDFFGEPGRTVRVTRGGRTTVKLTRVNIAERLYRVTGDGIYRDSMLTGERVPIAKPVLNQMVTGLDTFMHTAWRGRLFWLFGDTNKLSASLGSFSTTCAWSDLPSKGGLDPERGINLEYFANKEGFVKGMAAIPGEGMKWMFSLMVLRDPSGADRLVARYDRMKSLTEAYDSGLAVFDMTANEFRPLVSWGPMPGPVSPYGRPTRVSVKGVEYFYFSSPHPTPVVRVRADWNAVQDLSKYEALSCEAATCTWSAGRKPEKVTFTDVETGKPVEATAGSVQWNAFRQRWIAILQKNVGEVWYAEADTPSGPWAYARRVLRHDRYTFYWPGQVAEFDKDGGKRIYLMGTYTQSFSDAPVKTPLYDYNQVMYALSLDDPRMAMPVAMYRVRGQSSPLSREEIEQQSLWDEVEAVAHFQLGDKQFPVPDARMLIDRGARPVLR